MNVDFILRVHQKLNKKNITESSTIKDYQDFSGSELKGVEQFSDYRKHHAANGSEHVPRR